MNEQILLRAVVAVFDFAAAIAFGFVLGLLFFVGSDSDKMIINPFTMVIAIALMAFVCLGFAMAVVVGSKGASRAWIKANILYMAWAVVPVLALINIQDMEFKTWFPLLALPVMCCVALWRLIVLHKRQEQERLISEDLDEVNSSTCST